MAEELPRPIPWLDEGRRTAAFSTGASGPTAARPPASSNPGRAGVRRIHLPVLSSGGGAQALSRPPRSPASSRRSAHTFLSWIASRLPVPRRWLTDKPRPGSGLPPRRVIVILVWGRRFSQAAFLLLFLFLLTQTAFRGSFEAASGAPIRLPHRVEWFLQIDPFVAVITSLATHTLYAGLAWSLSMIVLTLVVGRAFCGWICPFGTLHHLTAWLFPNKALKGRTRVEANKTKAWQNGKYLGLVGLLGAAAAGSVIGGLFDPICVMVRAVGLGVLPALQYLGIRTADTISLSEVRVAQSASDASLDYLGNHVWTPEQAYFHHTWLILLLFLGIVALNRVIPRFWCRALCPLGALLGVFSRFAIFGMEKDHAKCTDCNLCLVGCQGADSPQGGVKHRRDECHLCFNCEAACPEDVIRFRWFPGLRSTSTRPGLSRRSALASVAAGAVLVPAGRIANWPDKAYSPKVIRPPGSVEEREFLERCIRCAECMKVCPNNALHPAFGEAGPEGVWTPILIPRIGYCEHSCVLCGQVCPTGAIQKIEEKHKLGQGVEAIVIGTAMFDRGRCLPWAMATPCTVCEEFCPTSPKAIWVEEVDVPKRGAVASAGQDPELGQVRVKRPHVDPNLCIGCGACEKVCPVVDRPAVYVTSAGESRSKTNVILLEDSAYS